MACNLLFSEMPFILQLASEKRSLGYRAAFKLVGSDEDVTKDTEDVKGTKAIADGLTVARSCGTREPSLRVTEGSISLPNSAAKFNPKMIVHFASREFRDYRKSSCALEAAVAWLDGNCDWK